MNMIKSGLKLILLSASTVVLTACMSLGNLSYKQAQALKKEGFSLTEEGWTLNFPENLLFDFDKSNVKESQKLALLHLSHQLQRYNLVTVRMIGHSDNIGNAKYNHDLSINRAAHVAQIFEDSGFKKENIEVIGRGSSQPLVDNTTPESRSLNRRVTLVIIP